MQKKNLGVSIGVAVLIVLMAFFLYTFTFRTINKVFFEASVEQTLETLAVIRDLGVNVIEDELGHLEAGLEETAASSAQGLTVDKPTEAAALLAGLALPKDGLDYWLAAPDGQVVDSAGRHLDWQSEVDLTDIFQAGQTTVIDPYFNAEGKYILSIAAPLYDKGQISALLLVRLDGFCVSRWLEDIQFGIGEGVAYIVNSEGRNIAASRTENYDWITSQYNSQELANADEESKTVAELERRALVGESGSGSYLWEGSRNYLVYAPVPKTGWGFYVGFYGDLINDYIKASAQKSLLSSAPFFGAVLAFFLLLFLYVNYNLKRERKYVKELLWQKQEIQKQAEDIMINEERLRVALAQTSNTIFEYDLQTGNITNFYSTSVTHSSDAADDLKEQLIRNCTLDEASLYNLQHVLEEAHKGIVSNECTIKAVCDQELTTWYRVSISPLSKQQTRVIGIMEDITKEKLAELDPLTGLLNKKVMTEQVLTYLQAPHSTQGFAFLMFDIDNFKNINDLYGHPVGDQVIIQTSQLLKKAFAKSALVGRVGGDEFCVFCYELTSPQQLKETLAHVYSEQRLVPAEGGSVITYSCGAVYCAAGLDQSFEALYGKADDALYKAKQRGRNQYYFYTIE